MKKNVGLLDRIARFLAAIVLCDLAVSHAVTGLWEILTWVVAIVLAVTALVSTCPLYSLLGINTCPHKKTTP